MQKREFLSSYMLKQYDTAKLKKIIKLFLEMTDNFQMVIDEDSYYIRITSSYEMKIGGNKKPISSKVEHFIINKYDSINKMQQLLLKYKIAFNSLNEMERVVFINTFIKQNSNEELCERLITYKDKIVLARKSGIVKFSIRLGLTKFTDLV